MTEIREPVTFLGDLAVEDVPDYLEHLAVVSRIVDGFALYESKRGNLERAQVVIAMVYSELAQAEQEVEEALSALAEP